MLKVGKGLLDFVVGCFIGSCMMMFVLGGVLLFVEYLKLDVSSVDFVVLMKVVLVEGVDIGEINKC